jgi:hypothetical protein
MMVQIVNFGTNWWARFGRDLSDRYRFTRRAAYYNSTGVRCGGKVRRHWVVPGLIRFNGVGDFKPHSPDCAIGNTFVCAGPDFACGGNRLLFKKKLPLSSAPECYLVVLSAAQHGRIDFASDCWKATTTSVIAASQLRQVQETMLLMKRGDWVRTDWGLWRLNIIEAPRAAVGLELISGPIEDATKLL